MHLLLKEIINLKSLRRNGFNNLHEVVNVYAKYSLVLRNVKLLQLLGRLSPNHEALSLSV